MDGPMAESPHGDGKWPEQLLIEAAQADPRHFAAIYEANFERIYAYVARRVRDRSTAEDVTADVFHQALANLEKFQWRGVPFAAWLYRIASNAIADHFHEQARTADPSSPEIEEADLSLVEQRATLYRLVDRLPTDQRRVIVMRFAEERSIREVAEELGRSEGAVKQLQFRALQMLRLRMGQSHG
jgi:RNA polymerase sigma-70 factor (ECF subfamily)